MTASARAQARPASEDQTARIDDGRYALRVPIDDRARIAWGWLMLSIAALIAAGVLSVLLVVARAPVLKDLFPLADFFHVALVVHVDLSVLVWFVAFAGMLWTINGNARALGIARFSLMTCLAGTALIALAPFAGRGGPIMSNYVPVLDDPIFLSGLAIFGAGFAVLSGRSLLVAVPVGRPVTRAGAIRFGLLAAVIAAVLALVAFLWSYLTMPGGIHGRAYYEILFWGGGHTVQFCWTLLMLVAWLWLAEKCGTPIALAPQAAIFCFALGLAPVFLVPVFYLLWDVASVEQMSMHTWLMRYAGGLAVVWIGLAIVVGLPRTPPRLAEQRPLYSALLVSILLFLVGGVFGFMIDGSDVRVPAHYHGSIVGVTLALMGLAYALIPELGFKAPATPLAAWQPWIYGIGQLLHITGLVWSGGYGVQRKVAGSAQVLRSPQEVAGMGLMGLGGLIAIVGGMLFLVVVFQSRRRADGKRS